MAGDLQHGARVARLCGNPREGGSMIFRAAGRRRGLQVLLVLGLVGWGASSAQASLILSANTGVLFQPNGGTPSTWADYSCVGQAGCTGSYGGVSASVGVIGASATAYASFGILRAASTAQPDRFDSFTVSSLAFMNDDVMITSTGVANGTSGTLNFDVLVLGGLTMGTPTVDMNGAADWVLNIGGGTTHTGGLQAYNDGTAYFVPYGDLHGGLYHESIPFVFGSEFALALHLQPTCTTYGVRCAADFSHTLYWGGITSVSANGATISAFDLTSASGTDWRQSFVPATDAVPEPGTLVLAGGGLIGLVVRRRRERQRTQPKD
jgi:hypothetical protein